MCFNQTGDISTLNGSFPKLVDKFTYRGSSVSSTKTDIDTRLANEWTANDSLSVIYYFLFPTLLSRSLSTISSASPSPLRFLGFFFSSLVRSKYLSLVSLSFIILFHASFSYLVDLIVFRWVLRNSKYYLISRTFLSILANFSSALDEMISIFPLISSLSSLFLRSLGIVPSVKTIIDITVTLMFRNFFISQAKSW